MSKQSEIHMNLASDETLKTLTAQVRTAQVPTYSGNSWPQVKPIHFEELLREIAYWRALAGLLEKTNE